jgi:hypothetical protein
MACFGLPGYPLGSGTGILHIQPAMWWPCGSPPPVGPSALTATEARHFDELTRAGSDTSLSSSVHPQKQIIAMRITSLGAGISPTVAAGMSVGSAVVELLLAALLVYGPVPR